MPPCKRSPLRRREKGGEKTRAAALFVEEMSQGRRRNNVRFSWQRPSPRCALGWSAPRMCQACPGRKREEGKGGSFAIWFDRDGSAPYIVPSAPAARRSATPFSPHRQPLCTIRNGPMHPTFSRYPSTLAAIHTNHLKRGKTPCSCSWTATAAKKGRGCVLRSRQARGT